VKYTTGFKVICSYYHWTTF